MTLEDRIAALEEQVAELKKLFSPAKTKNGKYSEGFEKFWGAWRKNASMSKAAAFKSWEKALRLTDEGTLFRGLAGYNSFLAAHPTQSACHPTTWLNQMRWEQSELLASVENPELRTVLRGTPEHKVWMDYYVSIGRYKDPNAAFLDKLTIPAANPPTSVVSHDPTN